MLNFLPGTAVELHKRGEISDFLRTLFSAGGLVLSQVMQLTGLNMHTVQNWVKRKYVRPPVGKKYDCSQFCTIVILNLLGGTFSLESIRRMLDFVELVHEEAPVLIYTLFVETLEEVSDSGPSAAVQAERAARRRVEAAGLEADVQKRLIQVVKILLLSHFSAEMALSAQQLMTALDI